MPQRRPHHPTATAGVSRAGPGRAGRRGAEGEAAGGSCGSIMKDVTVGTFNVPIRIGNLEATEWEELEALVDTGSTFSAAPRSILERLGIYPSRRQELELANGQIAEYEIGDALVQLQGQQAITPVVFAEAGEQAAVGAVTLETFLLAVDPATNA